MKKIILLLLITISHYLSAQTQFKSLQDIFDYADNHAFAIQSSEIQQQADKAKEQQAKAFLYPTVTAVSGYQDNITRQATLVPSKLFDPSATSDSFEEMTFGKQHIYNVGIQAQWDILNFQKIFASKTACISTHAGKINTEKAKFTTYNQLAAIYYSILLAQESIDIYSSNVEITKILLDNETERYKSGIGSEEDLNRVTIQHIGNEKNLEYSLSNLLQLNTQFQTLLNTDDDIIVSGRMDVSIVNNTDMETLTPEISWQEAQVRISESKLKQNKAMHLPSLSFQYQYNSNWAANDFMRFSNANKLPSQFLGVKLSIPIFTGFSTRGKVKEAKAELQWQQMRLENIQLVKQKEDETLKLQYHQTENSLKKTKKMLDLQTINDTHSNNKYESGIISLDTRMDKYVDLLAAQSNYLQVLADYSIAQYKIYIRQIKFNL